MRTLPCLVFSLVLSLGCAAADNSGEVRTWTSTGGQTIKASLVDVSRDGNTLVLAKEGGEKFRIHRDKLCAADQEYVRLTRLKQADTDGRLIVYEGENITFSVGRNGELSLQGMGTKKTWPKGRPPKAKRSRHTGKLMPVKIEPGKGPVVVNEQVSWTNTPPAEFIAMLEKVVKRSETAVEARARVKRYEICGGLELNGDRLCGLSISFEADAALMELPRGKREMRYKQGNLTSATVTVCTHDGKESSDLTELSETLNETQQKALLQALRTVPLDKLGRP